MDAHELRVLRREAGALARPTIEYTRVQLAGFPDLAALLGRALAGAPLPRHSEAPPSEPDYLRVGLDPAQLEAVIAALISIEADRQDATPDEGHLSFAPTLVDVWSGLRKSAQGPHRSR